MNADSKQKAYLRLSVFICGYKRVLKRGSEPAPAGETQYTPAFPLSAGERQLRMETRTDRSTPKKTVYHEADGRQSLPLAFYFFPLFFSAASSAGSSLLSTSLKSACLRRSTLDGGACSWR